MLRSPQHLLLPLSVAPARRAFTTAATTSSYGADKPPPPLSSSSSSSSSPPSSPTSSAVSSSAASSSAVSSSATSATSTSASAAAAAAAAAASAAAAAAKARAASATVRTFRLATEENVAVRQVRRSAAMASASSAAQPVHRSHSEERPPSQAHADDDADAPRQTRTPSRLTTYFPLGYREAVQQWWSCGSAPAAERGVLAYVPYLREAKVGSQPDLGFTTQQRKQHGHAQDAAQHLSAAPEASSSAPSDDPFGARLWRSQMVALPGKNRALNEYSVERVGEENTDTLVMVHGYGAGLGFFYRNFEPLSRLGGWRLYALDLLGMGNSSRPPFKIRAKEPQAKIAEAESWFVDALEDWRVARKIDRFTLLGHSMGGYLAVSYALKYPGHVNKLILASPVGVPEDPYAVSAAMPAEEPEESTLASEFTQDQHAVAGATGGGAAAAATGRAPNHNYRFNHNLQKKAAAKPERRPLPSWLVWLWDANVSPFSIVRVSGPLGPRLVSGWTSRRFSHLSADEADALHTYTYSLFRQRGSGEYALPYLLAPGAYARSPVINRIQNVGRQVVRPAQPATADGRPAQPEVRETGLPVVMMYGDHDWMDVAGGYAAEEKVKQRIVQTLLHGTPEERRRENGSAKVLIVRNAGHHLYLDNPDEFNKYVQQELVDTQESERRRRQQLVEHDR